MERILIGQLGEHIDTEVTINGWVDVARNQGKMAFFDFRDRSGMVQGVIFGKPEVLEVGKSLRAEYVVSVTGKVNKRPEKMVKDGVQNGDIELEITGIEILNSAAEMPFDLDTDLNLDTLLDYRPLTLRRERERAIFKVQAAIVDAYRSYMNGENFVEFQSPALVGGDAEGGAGVFSLDYFNEKKAFLATSPQFYKQILTGVYERVFTIARVFRAEKHSTTRHLNEYVSIDAEMGFITDHTDIMAVETELLRFVCSHLTNTCESEFKTLNAEIPVIPKEIPRLKLREAQELLFKETGTDKRTEPDLEPEDERWLCEWSKKEHDSDFIFVTHYPVEKRPFYTYEDENDPGYTKSFDLLFRGVEITTGGQRRHEFTSLKEGAEKKGLDPEVFAFYMQAFKYGMPPHGGWGMGLERLTQKFLGLENIKEATLFPRDMNRIDTLLSKDNT